MPTIEEIVNLRLKGLSQQEIGNQLNITQEAVSKTLRRAKREGLWNGNSGKTLTEENLTLNGQAQKTKGSYRCSNCSKLLTPINEVIFNPSHLKQTLKQNDFTHVCTTCKIAYGHVSNISNEKPESCHQCKRQMTQLTIKGVPTNAYYCFSCKQAFVIDKNGEKETEENKTEVSSKIRTAMKNIQD